MYVITFHLLRKKKHHHEETYPHPQFIDDAAETQGGETGYHLYMPYKGGSESSPNACTVRAGFAMKPAWVVIFFCCNEDTVAQTRLGLTEKRLQNQVCDVWCVLLISFQSHKNFERHFLGLLFPSRRPKLGQCSKPLICR